MESEKIIKKYFLCKSHVTRSKYFLIFFCLFHLEMEKNMFFFFFEPPPKVIAISWASYSGVQLVVSRSLPRYTDSFSLWIYSACCQAPSEAPYSHTPPQAVHLVTEGCLPYMYFYFFWIIANEIWTLLCIVTYKTGSATSKWPFFGIWIQRTKK